MLVGAEVSVGLQAVNQTAHGRLHGVTPGHVGHQATVSGQVIGFVQIAQGDVGHAVGHHQHVGGLQFFNSIDGGAE